MECPVITTGVLLGMGAEVNQLRIGLITSSAAVRNP
jgi:hypothetical protein